MAGLDLRTVCEYCTTGRERSVPAGALHRLSDRWRFRHSHLCRDVRRYRLLAIPRPISLAMLEAGATGIVARDGSAGATLKRNWRTATPGRDSDFMDLARPPILRFKWRAFRARKCLPLSGQAMKALPNLPCAWARSGAGRSDQPAPAPLDAAIIFAPAGELVPAALEGGTSNPEGWSCVAEST